MPLGIGGAAASLHGSSVGAGGSALAIAEVPDGEDTELDDRDTRLDQLPMQLDVMVRVHSLRVEDLLALEKGTVLETIQEHSQDVPVVCGGALLVWGEFEVLDQRLAVRITRLA